MAASMSVSRSLVGSSRIEHVRLAQQDEQQLQPALLATRQILDRGRELSARETHPLQKLARCHLLAPGNIGAALAANHVTDPVVPDVLELEELLR